MTAVTIARRREEAPSRRRRPSWFWWTLVNVTALCFAVMAWVACLFVFSHPEIPRNYKILERLGRTPELTAFTALDAPEGTLADPRALYRRFLPLGAHRLAMLNPRLLHNYLTNFEETLLNTYVEGDFRVQQVRKLTPDDLFFPGFAVRAGAEVRHREKQPAGPYPVWIDCLFPTDSPEAADWFVPGDQLVIEKVPDCAVVVRADRGSSGDEPLLVLTVVPLACDEHVMADGRSFPISPPERINPSARLPAFPLPADESDGGE